MTRSSNGTLHRCLEAVRLFESAQALCAQGEFKGGLDGLWQARRLDDRNALIHAFLVETLLKQASAELDKDPKFSEQLVSQAIELDPVNSAAANLQRTIRERHRDHAMDVILSRSREVQTPGDVDAALTVIQKGLDSYPDEPRLVQRKDALDLQRSPLSLQSRRMVSEAARILKLILLLKSTDLPGGSLPAGLFDICADATLSF